jgi:hypothetical protein
MVLRLYRKYSDSAIRIRRTSRVEAAGACTSIGSLVAKISTPACRSSFSSRRLSSMSRPARLMSSQITALNGHCPDATAARRSAMPPSRGTPASANSRHRSTWLRASRSIPPDSTSQ